MMFRNRLCAVVTVLSVMCILAPNALTQEQPISATPEPENLRRDLETFQRSFIEIKRRCIYERSARELLQSALKGMVEDLKDPYSSYLSNETANKMKSLLQEEQSELTGIGVQMGYEDSQLKVIAPIQDSPAWRAGIQAGDRITQVDGVVVENMDDAVSRITGEKGTAVKITVIRSGLKEPIEFNLVREPITLKNVNREVICPPIGYVRLASFSNRSRTEIIEALKFLEVSGCTAFILDLRSNPGGLLEAAIGVTDLFLEKGLLITYTVPRDEAGKKEWYASGQTDYSKQPLVVLINRGSASASEIVTGALKDHHRATVIGEKSFGKGSVQEIIDLPDGSALKLTVAKYHTPSGICIHEMGIEPDITVAGEQESSAGTEKPSDVLTSLHERWHFEERILKGLQRDPTLLAAVNKLSQQIQP
ncbi:MAG TPA: S41 family peptidase [bacterium]|nr:S41 family peptidase [bacterium]